MEKLLKCNSNILNVMFTLTICKYRQIKLKFLTHVTYVHYAAQHPGPEQHSEVEPLNFLSSCMPQETPYQFGLHT
jgi:hypothetical protein